MYFAAACVPPPQLQPVSHACLASPIPEPYLQRAWRHLRTFPTVHKSSCPASPAGLPVSPMSLARLGAYPLSGRQGMLDHSSESSLYVPLAQNGPASDEWCLGTS